MKYALEIEHQNAAIEIRTTPARLRINSKRPSFTVSRQNAKLNIERQTPGYRPRKPFAPPQQQELSGGSEPRDVVQLSKRFEGYASGTEAVKSMAGRYVEQSANADGGDSLATAQQMQRAATEKSEARRETASEHFEWDPGYVKMSWDAHSIDLQWDVHPLEIEYEPYSVEISMKSYPSVSIRAYAIAVGRRVDRRI